MKNIFISFLGLFLFHIANAQIIDTFENLEKQGNPWTTLLKTYKSVQHIDTSRCAFKTKEDQQKAMSLILSSFMADFKAYYEKKSYKFPQIELNFNMFFDTNGNLEHFIYTTMPFKTIYQLNQKDKETLEEALKMVLDKFKVSLNCESKFYQSLTYIQN